MARVMITQRVAENSSYPERRDCLDQRWFAFLEKAGILAQAVPNTLTYTQLLFEQEMPRGIILTGGNSLVSLNGDAAERDEVEKWLLQQAIQYKLPVIGVCRGMQLIAECFQSELIACEGHAGTRHEIKIDHDGSTRMVNSYHHYGVKKLDNELQPIAYAMDHTVEACKHNTLPIYGIMWHPEREEPFQDADIELFTMLAGIS